MSSFQKSVTHLLVMGRQSYCAGSVDPQYNRRNTTMEYWLICVRSFRMTSSSSFVSRMTRDSSAMSSWSICVKREEKPHVDEFLLSAIGGVAAVVDLRENGQRQLEGNHLPHLDETVDDRAEEERRRLDVVVDGRLRVEEDLLV